MEGSAKIAKMRSDRIEGGLAGDDSEPRAKRLPSTWSDAKEDETDAWTPQADEAMGEDGHKTKRMRICGQTRKTSAPMMANGRPMT